MRRFLYILMVGLWLATPAAAGTRPSDAQVDAAVKRGVKWLLAEQKDNGSWDSKYIRQYGGGTEALAILALLAADEDPSGTQVKKAIEHLLKVEVETVYARAVRAMVYARLPGEENQKRLGQDIGWLLKQQDRGGGWGYGPKQRPDWVDTSNTQLTLLALADASDAGAAVSPIVWKRARTFWLRAQNEDGGWGYEPPAVGKPRLRAASYGSLSAAGVASLIICGEKTIGQDEPEVPGKKSDAQLAREAVDKGVRWIAGHYSTTQVPQWAWGNTEDWLFYYLFCLARVGDGTGLKYFDRNEWYADMAASILGLQQGDGSWSTGNGNEDKEAVIRTSFAILALCKGRPPVLMNKVTLAGGDTRDVAAVTKWFSRTFDYPVSWQQLPPEPNLAMLWDAPLLYVEAAPKAPMTPTLAKTIADYVREGGTVVVQSSAGEDKAVTDALTAALPEYAATALPGDHAIFSLRLKTSPATVVGIGDRLRTRVFIVTDDWSGVWRRSTPKDSPPQFQQFANLFFYATDLAWPKGKLTPARAVTAAPAVAKTVAVGRVKHAGDWSICPRAMAAVSNTVAAAVSLGVKEQTIDLSQPVPAHVPLLWLTGTTKPLIAGTEVQNLKAYIQGGGTLFIDSAVGGEEFFNLAVKVVADAFDSPPQPLAADHPLITGKLPGSAGADITSVTFTRALKAKLGEQAAPSLVGLSVNGRLAVIISRYGVTASLDGAPVYNNMGYSTPDARRLAANVLLYAVCR